MRDLKKQIDGEGLNKETMAALKEIAVLSNDMKKAYEEAVNDTLQHIAGREDSLLRTYVESRKVDAESGAASEFDGRINGIVFSSPRE